jgi:N-hydroxyarylamine O-acetyltransferase
MDETTLEAYFGRLAVPRPHTADAVNLHVLHRAHQMRVPFENLSIHLSEPVLLAEDVLVDKIVTRRRGGFCYELNGAFAILLEAMGAEVRRVAARVYGSDGHVGPPLDHMALVVRASDASGPWLIDVGFGSHSVYPLLFDSRHEQNDPAGRFLLVDSGEGDVDVFKDGKPQYRIEPKERSLADFIPTCWWQTTSPDSYFTQDIICSRLTKDGRVSIAGRTLIITENGSRAEQQLTGDNALLAAYREHFGIILDTVPQVIRAPSGAPPAAVPPGSLPAAPSSAAPPAAPSSAVPSSAAPPAAPSSAAPPAAPSSAAPSSAAPPAAPVRTVLSAPPVGAGVGPSPLSGPSPVVSPGTCESGFPDGVVVRETDAGRVELL